ncbi:MAG: serine/threonine-protein kinase [Pirellulales bacterium]
MHPEQLGPYRIEQKLGRGGMGAVYAAHDASSDRRVAVKVLVPQMAADAGFRLRFEAEIESLKKLLHPGIVRLYGYGRQDGTLYYAMELVDGTSLEDELRAGRRFDWRETADLAVQICRALRHAHDNGIIHRDIKPANLLLGRNGDVRLSDFGIARLFGNRLTGSGGVIGTAEYMSPEQADGRPATPRSDLYSLGCVFYALLAGRPPFQADSFPAMLHHHCFTPPTPISEVAPDTPASLGRVVMRLLAKDPHKRFASAQLVAREIESLREEILQAEPRQGDTPPRATSELVGRAGAGPSTTGPAEALAASAAASIDAPAPPQPDRFTEVTTATSVGTETSTLWQVLRSPQTLMLATLLLAVIGSLAWVARGPTTDELWVRVQAAADAEDPERLVGVDGDVQQLLERLPPSDPRRESVETYREMITLVRRDRRVRRQLPDSQRRAALSPVERLYAEALDAAQVDPDEGVERLETLIVFYDVPGDDSPNVRRTVALAQRQLRSLRPLALKRREEHMKIVGERLRFAESIATTNRPAADKIRAAVIQQYAQKPWAAKLVAKAQRSLAAHKK